MEQKKRAKSIAKAIVNVLNTSLMVDANSTACIYYYQPETPKELSRFKRHK